MRSWPRPRRSLARAGDRAQGRLSLRESSATFAERKATIREAGAGDCRERPPWRSLMEGEDVRLRSRILIVVAALFALLVATCIIFPPIARVGCGWPPVEIQVAVIDTVALKPVSNATVTIFRAQTTPLDTDIRHLSRSCFSPETERACAQSAVTDDHGRCQFSYHFFAAMETWYYCFGRYKHTTGSVRTTGTWLRVTAAGRPTALIPLDRQSLKGRDLNDDTPIYVTVVMNSASADSETKVKRPPPAAKRH
jgi:hypothetical protein